MTRSTLMVALGMVLPACYTQRPMTTAEPAPATRIVADVTDAGLASLSDALGPGALALEAVIATADRDAWSLQMLRVVHRDGSSVPWNGEVVDVSPAVLTNVRERRLDRGRSWLAAGAITVGAIVIARLFPLIGASESPGGEPVPPSVRIPAGG